MDCAAILQALYQSEINFELLLADCRSGLRDATRLRHGSLGFAETASRLIRVRRHRAVQPEDAEGA
jgi:hypothetical protein